MVARSEKFSCAKNHLHASVSLRRRFHDAVLHDKLGIERDALKTKGVAERMPIIRDVKALLARVNTHLVDSSLSVQIRLTLLRAIDN